MVTAWLLASLVTAAAPDASAQAYTHVILAERHAAQGNAAAAVTELRLALVFDYDSSYLHARLRQLVGAPKAIAQRGKRRAPSLDPRLQADTTAASPGKNVAER